MNIIRKVFVKQIITEKSKQKIKARFLEAKTRLEQECQQLLFEQRKLNRKKGVSKAEIEHRFQREIGNRKDKIKKIEFKIEQLEILEIGSEIVEKEVDALVEVSVGTEWDKIQDRSIVIKDGIVARIDELR